MVLIQQVLILQEKVVAMVDVIVHREIQEVLVVVVAEVVVVRLLQVDQQHNLVNQGYQDQQDLEMQEGQEVLVQHKLELVVVEQVLLDNREEFQNQVRLLEEQVKI
tara:strand:- start:225 stop:542 length:318 start_codon:yes stop_codon:yes gene_type:complete